MKKKISAISAILALAIIAVIVLLNVHGGNVMAMESTISDRLKSEGFHVDLQVTEKEFAVTLVSTAQERAEPEDILTLRRVRNEARSYIKKNKGNSVPYVLKENIVNPKGDIIYEASLNNALVIPEDITSPALLDSSEGIDDNEVKNILDKLFKSEDLDIDISSISKSMLGGKFVDMKLKNHNNDYNYINEKIPQIQALVEAINQKDAKIVEYTLTVQSDDTDEVLLLLSADLMYRDFLWWQSLEFGSGTWTKSSPAMMPSDEIDEADENTDTNQISTTKTPEDAASGY